MIDSGRSKFVKCEDGEWINTDYILGIEVKQLPITDYNEPLHFHAVANICYNNHVFVRGLPIMEHQKNWTHKEWQTYLDEFMYDQGLCNGKD